MLITDEYRELNRKLHENPEYGNNGSKLFKDVLFIADGNKDILDYGCGKRTLEKALGFPIKNYDPCIEGLDSPPEPADVVICGDVLEHIEPECLGDVLDDLRRVTIGKGLFLIATRPAKKILADGRNAHLIQQDYKWWLPKLWSRFDVDRFQNMNGKFIVVVK